MPGQAWSRCSTGSSLIGCPPRCRVWLSHGVPSVEYRGGMWFKRGPLSSKWSSWTSGRADLGASQRGEDRCDPRPWLLEPHTASDPAVGGAQSLLSVSLRPERTYRDHD